MHNVKVTISGEDSPAVERLANAIRDGLRDQVSVSPWQLEINYEFKGELEEYRPPIVIAKLTNVKR